MVTPMRFVLSWICEEVGVVKGVHLLSGEVRSVTTALKVVEEVQKEVQEVKDEWEDEVVEGNGGLMWRAQVKLKPRCGVQSWRQKPD